MRRFAWGLVAIGLLIALLWPIYVEMARSRTAGYARTLIARMDIDGPGVPGGPWEIDRQIALREARAAQDLGLGAGILLGLGAAAFGTLLLAIRRPGPMTTLAVIGMLLASCTLPGYQGGPPPRSTQYTYPGRAVNPDSGLLHSATPTPVEAEDGGVFAYGLVFHDGKTMTSLDRFDTFRDCEKARLAFGDRAMARVKEDGAAPVMTMKCFRAHETPTMQAK